VTNNSKPDADDGDDDVDLELFDCHDDYDEGACFDDDPFFFLKITDFFFF
jgi:hypothetical protein